MTTTRMTKTDWDFINAGLALLQVELDDAEDMVARERDRAEDPEDASFDAAEADIEARRSAIWKTRTKVHERRARDGASRRAR